MSLLTTMKRLAAAFIGISMILSSCVSAPWSVPHETGVYVHTPGDSLPFWQGVMTTATAVRYQARGSTTFCNVFVADTLRKYFGRETYEKAFPNGLKAPDVVYREWQSNPHLFLLDPKRYSLPQIQALADQGSLILLSYYYDKGKSHLAFVGNSRLDMFTIPPIERLEGVEASRLSPAWLPAVVQAGTYTGVTSAVYASNGWLDSPVHPFKSGIVKFYLVEASG